MRKIIVLEFITLDGVIQAPGAKEEDNSGEFKFGGWTVPLTDEFMGKVMDGQMSGEYDLLLGPKRMISGRDIGHNIQKDGLK